MIGKIISISELNVKVFLYDNQKVEIKDILCASLKNQNYRFEVASIDEYAFNNCTELVSIEIPEDVNDIKANAFLNANAF